MVRFRVHAASRQLRTAARIAAAAGLLVATAATPANAAWPGTNGIIAFSSSRDGQRNIYVTTGPSSPDVQLTNAVADDSNPSFSPDGQVIAFVSRRNNTTVGGVPQIWTMNANGSSQFDQSNDTVPSTEPSWSSDGTKILYSRPDPTSGLHSQLWIMNADGTNKHSLFATPANANDNQAVWSPTGNTVAFVSDRSGQPQIYTVSVDPTTGLTNSPATLRSDGNAQDTKPDWSPAPVSGSYRIAFASGTIGAHQIWTMHDDGTSRLQITTGTADNFDPAYSPDGNNLVFTSHPQATAVVLTASVNTTGGPVTDVTQANGSEGANDEPNWGAATIPPDVPEVPWPVLLPMSTLLILGIRAVRPTARPAQPSAG